MNKSTEISDKVNMEAVFYQPSAKGLHKQRAIVTYSPSSGQLHFNAKMVDILDIEDWDQVMVGYDPNSKIIILKQTDPEVMGTIIVRKGPSSSKHLKKTATKEALDRIMKVRRISIAHLQRRVGELGRAFKAERNGKMVFLEAISNGSVDGV